MGMAVVWRLDIHVIYASYAKVVKFSSLLWSPHQPLSLQKHISTPCICCWYDSGTIPTHRLMQAEAFRRISVKLCKSRWLPAYKKTMTLCTYKLVNFLLSILMHQTVATPGVLSLSHLLLSLPLFPMLLPYLWSSLRSFPIPWPCLLPFHCKSSFYILYYTVYFHLLTVTLFIHCLVVIFWAIVSILPVV
jgi:hypothetical protein